jgi:Lrp/AsnC family leucine-responsive transcriptional regulator
MLQLDDTDRKILEVLQEDGRITNNKLAKEIGLTTTPTLERVRRLEKSGLIKGYRAILDEKKLGKSMSVFASVSLTMHNHKTVQEFCEAIQDLHQILAAHHISGEGDFLLKIVVSSTAEYESFLLNHLTQLPGVQKIQTTVVLSTKKEETKLPIENMKDKL